MHTFLLVLTGAIGIGIGIGASFFLPGLAERAQVASVAGAFEEDAEISDIEEGGSPRELFDVVKVIDGDTVTLSMHGKNETLRLIGIDTPETGGSRGNVECFAKEATEKLKEVIGERVAVEKDESQGERDRYGRLLAYLFSESGVNLNKLLIEEGYASEYTYRDPYAFQEEFQDAEKGARDAERGLWAKGACPEPVKQKTSSIPKQAPTTAVIAPAPTPSPQPSTTPPVPMQTAPEPKKEEVPEPKPEPKPEPEPEEPSASYTCSSNTYNCSDFKTQAEAQAVYEQCGGVDNDVHRLDRNKDGQVCESLP